MYGPLLNMSHVVAVEFEAVLILRQHRVSLSAYYGFQTIAAR